MFILRQFKVFIFNKETLFWLFTAGVFAIVLKFELPVPLFYGHFISINQQTTPGLVLAFALAMTALWSYIFLIIPVYRMKGVFSQMRVRWLVFHITFWFSIALSLFFVGMYLTALADKSPCPNAEIINDGAELILREFRSAVPVVGLWLYDLHLIIFVVLYTIMDLMIAHSQADEQTRKKFRNVVVFVDTPIILTMATISFVFHPLLVKQFYYFEAGVIAFQLMAGSLSVIAIEMVNEQARSEHGMREATLEAALQELTTAQRSRKKKQAKAMPASPAAG
jgi:hypothetical protein